MKSNKNTKLWIRVFFLIAIFSLFGGIWQLQKKLLVEVKTSGGSFSEGIVGTPRFINPVLAQSQSDHDLTRLVFGSLLEVDEHGEIDYLLAEKLSSDPDKKRYELSLKPNIYFQDGERITAEDLIFTIEKIQDPLIKSPLFSQWEGIEVKKKDTLSVEFLLSQSYADFPENLDIGILPKHIWSKIPTASFIFNTNNNKPIGSGPYLVKNITYKKTGIPKSYILESSPYHKNFIQKIKLFFYENEAELAKAFRDGDIDAAYGLSANSQNKDLFHKETSITGQLPRIFGLFYNPQKNSLLKDASIRKLIEGSLDKEALIDEVFAGYAYPIDSPLGKVSYTKKDELARQAQEALIKKGWKKNSEGILQKDLGENKKSLKLEFKVSIPNTKDILELSEKIKEQLAEHGIAITIQPFEKSILEQKIIRLRDYEILLFGYMIERDSDLYAFWHSSQISDPGLNISLYRDAKVDVELEKLRTKGEAANMELIEKRIQDYRPASFIYSPAFTYILPRKIKGENINSLTERSDRFAHISDWYIQTRHVWKMFTKK